MKKATALVVVLMFGVAAWAYQASSGASTKASTTAKTSTASTTKSTTHTKAAAAGPKESTITGCLSGPNADGEYLVKNGNHRHGMEVVGTDDLKAHAGHKVKLTGTWAKESAEAEEKEAKEEKGEKGEKGEKEANEKIFKVSKVGMIAETCTVPEPAKKSTAKPAATKTK